jgi:ABC-type transport system involved in multi-copper enzyme maturation permease subunit
MARALAANVTASVVRGSTIALNTYREAVRARVLLGVFGLGLASVLYSLVVATLSLHNEARVVADLGAAGMSLFGVVVAVILGSTSLYRELEHKTVFPILSRPIRRWEYVVGKYFGAVLTVAVFIAADCAAVLSALAIEGGQPVEKVGAVLGGIAAAAALVTWRATRGRVFVAIPWSLVLAVAAWSLAWPEPEERRLVVASSLLALCEVGVVAAVATLFSSFSSPFLTAALTSGIFIVGRSADSLAHMPKKVFGAFPAAGGRIVAHVVPNLQVYVPARSLLLGNVPGHPLWPYVGAAAAQAVFYSTALVVVGTLAFRRRDFS